ncbi:MAG: Gldg family protein [Kiritimatiellae bacterium]|nr:Gldg family protein [Kiritimatiellia bacterium]
MSPVRVTWHRTIGRARSLFSTAFATAAFLSATAALFAFRLDAAEGLSFSVASLWAASVSPFLPALAAFLAMDVWSDELQTGRIELLLTTPVKEREFTLGKFLGVFTLLVLAAFLSFATTVVALRVYAPSALDGVGVLGFCPAFLALMLQGVLWCAVSVAMSSLFRHAAAAACASLILLVGLPRGGWAALLAWAPQGRTAFGEMLLDAHVIDMSSGLFSSGTVLSYLFLSSFFLFAASKSIATSRFAGRGGRSLRVSSAFAVLLSGVFSVLAVELVNRLDSKIDLPVGNVETEFSARTRSILSEAHGEMSVTCFLSRKDARFRPVGHFLRRLQRESASLGGLKIELRFVDPLWDLGAAERLVRLGASEGSLVFEKGRRHAVLQLSEGYGERICASSIQSLTMPPQRRNVYWTVGHGETANDDYGAFGMSDIARELAREGYRNMTIDLAGDAQIPSDCALIVVAGAKEDFSRAEAGRIESYLRAGGRLLVLLSKTESGGVTSLLPGWGLRPSPAATTGAKSISGTDLIVGEFSEHAISKPLQGSRVVLERPVGFMPSAAAETGTGADRIEFTPLAKAGTAVVAATVERGVGAGADLSIRPMRIIAIGDAGFVMNGQLSARANANRDFFLNCVAYLSGTDASVASGTETNVLATGLDRASRARFVVVVAGAVPLVVLLVLMAVAARRRRRG